MNTSKATLAGVTLVNAQSVAWSLSVGVRPHIGTFTVHATDADTLRGKVGLADPVSLVIEPDGRPKLEVRNLYVVGEAPAPEPYLASFYVADVRVLWKRVWIYRHFNVLRRTGDRRLIGGIPTQIDVGIDSFTYADWSLDNPAGTSPKRFTAESALRSILTRVTKGDFRIEGDVPDVAIQGAEHDDSGDNALSRILAHVTGWDVVVDYDGTTIAFDANDVRAAGAIIAGKSRESAVEGSQIPAKAALRTIRPSKIRTLYNREVELRVNSVSEASSVTRGVNDFDMENVAPVPDDTLSITEGGKTRVVTRGTWIPIRLLLSAWNASLASGSPPISFDVIRRYYLSANSLEFLYCGLGSPRPEANWVARIATLREHFRKTYQISNKVMRHCKGLRAKRLGVYDPVSGVTAPAGVFMDYAISPSWKGRLNDPGHQFAMMNVHGYPANGASVDGSGARQAPAVVNILDQDLGIVHLEFRRDTFGLYDSFVPGLIVDENGAEKSTDLDTSKWRVNPIGLDCGVKGTNNFLFLSAQHRVAIVLTALPASPNDETQFHDVAVASGDIKGMVQNWDVAGSGPEWSVRIGAGLQTARILWVENRETVYQKMFGMAGVGIAGADVPKDMIVNGKTLEEAAKAKAAALLSTMVDHYDGTKTTHWDPSDQTIPRGNVDVVTHTLTPAGVLLTNVTANPTLAGRDLLAYMPDSVRTQVFRILPPGSA